MAFPTRYFHTVIAVPYETMGYPSSAAYETSVTREDGVYVHRSYDAATGRSHERYFDSLREFVVWHYSAAAGIDVGVDSYAWEKEVKVHRFPAGAGAMRRVEFFEPLTPTWSVDAAEEAEEAEAAAIANAAAAAGGFGRKNPKRACRRST